MIRLADIHEDDDRSTEELINTLNEDVDHCWALVIKAIDEGERTEDGCLLADTEFGSRQFIRAVFAYLEAATFSMKMWAVDQLMESDDIDDAERILAFESKFDLDDKGRVVESNAKIGLSKNIKFAFVLLDRVHGREKDTLDTSEKWWAWLQSSIKVRDRLTHPKLPHDIDVTIPELFAAMDAVNGFNKLAESYLERPA